MIRAVKTIIATTTMITTTITGTKNIITCFAIHCYNNRFHHHQNYQHNKIDCYSYTNK